MTEKKMMMTIMTSKWKQHLVTMMMMWKKYKCYPGITKQQKDI